MYVDNGTAKVPILEKIGAYVRGSTSKICNSPRTLFVWLFNTYNISLMELNLSKNYGMVLLAKRRLVVVC